MMPSIHVHEVAAKKWQIFIGDRPVGPVRKKADVEELYTVVNWLEEVFRDPWVVRHFLLVQKIRAWVQCKRIHGTPSLEDHNAAQLSAELARDVFYLDAMIVADEAQV